MSPMTAAIVIFALMWIGIIACAWRLYTWLFRVDRLDRDGKAPFDRGL